MIDPIDFSDRENEFLPRELKRAVLGFSVCWSVIGLVFSSWFFLRTSRGPAGEILDRRAAEGRILKVEPLRRSPSYNDGYLSHPFQVSSLIKSQAQDDRWSSLVKLNEEASAPSSSESFSALRSKVTLQLSTGDAPEKPRRLQRERFRTSPSPAKLNTPSSPGIDLSRLLYPVSPDRPPHVGFARVADQANRQNVRVELPDGTIQVGLLLDSSGIALVTAQAANQGNLTRIWVGRERSSATLIGLDTSLNIALIQVASSFGATSVPLAPAPPASGEKLLTILPDLTGSTLTTSLAGVGFGSAGFTVEGEFRSSNGGSPLFNDRGELIGFYVKSLPGALGSGVHLAVDSAGIYRLVRGYKDKDSTDVGFTNEALARLTSAAVQAQGAGALKRGRIIPGAGIGAFGLGMSSDEVKLLVTAPEVRDVGQGLTLWTSQAPSVDLYFIHDRLFSVATRFSGYATLSGLSVGARLGGAEVKREFSTSLVLDRTVLTPGLEVCLDAQVKAESFIVRPNL